MSRSVTAALALALALAGTAVVSAHGVSGKDAVFLQSIRGAAIGPLMYLGAKHMMTGYDHLAFLVGVIFFLYRLKDIVWYVSLFTIGHSLTLLVGVLGGVRANPYLVDAIIGCSVVYKAFDNMCGQVSTNIRLKIMRKGQDKPLDLTVVRDIIRTRSVRMRRNSSGVKRCAQACAGAT